LISSGLFHASQTVSKSDLTMVSIVIFISESPKV
jgi:hypothetical protein